MNTEQAFAIVGFKMFQWMLHGIWFLIPPVMFVCAGRASLEDEKGDNFSVVPFAVGCLAYATILIGYSLGWNVR